MSLRIKLFIFPALAIAAAAALVAVGSERYARRQFQQAEQQRTDTFVEQFHRELAQRGDEVIRAVQGVADSEATLRMALDLTRPQADPSIYANDAHGLANTYHLDFLEFTAADGTLISSSHWAPASGYRNEWVAGESDWNRQGAFLNRMELPQGAELGLLSVRAVRIGERNMYVIGGWRFDREFLKTMALPEGMRALLYASLEPRFIPDALAGPDGPVAEPEGFAPIISSLQRGESSQPSTIQSFEQSRKTETFVTVPLQGRGKELLSALLVGSSQQNLVELVNYIRSLALAAAAGGILFSLVLSWVVSRRITHPLARLTEAAREVKSGKWSLRPDQLELQPRGETGPLAVAFADMVGQLARERERLVQRERVAARREMARRFARDLKESLFPLHMAAEDVVQAREETSERFDEIFFESTTIMRAELDRLKNVAARFGEFARMPQPRPVSLNLNEAVRNVLKSIESQLRASERPPVTPEIHLAEPDPVIEADPDLLRAALENLLLQCLDTMHAGGTLAIRTREKDGRVRIEVSARGACLSAEDCQRLFTPAGSTLEGMTGLGLATAQAIVNDHGGRISAEVAPDTGVTLRLEFSAVPAGTTRYGLHQSARPAKKETARLAVREKARLALPPAPADAPGPEPPQMAPAELVEVAVVAAESAPADSDETSKSVEPAGTTDQLSESVRVLRGLTFTQ